MTRSPGVFGRSTEHSNGLSILLKRVGILTLAIGWTTCQESHTLRSSGCGAVSALGGPASGGG